jgi:hypothetical protein
MAIVIGEQLETPDSLFFAMEVKARLPEHAFAQLGMARINSSQVLALIRWQRWQILFGFQVEGLLRQKFMEGRRSHDVITSSCLLEDYERIIELRPGKFWPGKAQMFELLKRLPSVTLVDEAVQWLGGRQREFWDSVTFTVSNRADDADSYQVT